MRAAQRFATLETAPVERVVKDGRRTVDARAAVVAMAVTGPPPAPGDVGGSEEHVGAAEPDNGGEGGACAILDVVVRHTTPAVRPDDVLTALRQAAALSTPITPVVTRLAQGLLGDPPSVTGELLAESAGRLTDPLAPDAAEATPHGMTTPTPPLHG